MIVKELKHLCRRSRKIAGLALPGLQGPGENDSGFN